MKLVKENILPIFEEVIRKHNYFLIDIVFRGSDKNVVMEIFVDNQSGVTTEGCAEISRELASILDEQLGITEKYRLDVSSPGVDRPLKFIEQYPKHIGRKFEIKYSDNDELKKFTGILKQIENDDLFFESSKTEIKINFNSIKTAKVLVSF